MAILADPTTDNTFTSTQRSPTIPPSFAFGISDHKLERLVSLKGLQRFWGQFGSWTGLGPDDSFLLVRDISSQEIYALDWQQP